MEDIKNNLGECNMTIDNKLYDEISNAIFSLPIFDTHEHLIAEEDRRKSNLDFSLFFMMYAGTDLRNSGMKEEDYLAFQDKKVDLEKKWNYFSEHWKNIKNTSYSKVILEAVNGLYGYEDINEENYVQLSEKIKKTSGLNWYDKVIKESNVKKILNHLENIWQADIKIIKRPEFKPVIHVDDIICLCCREDVFALEKKFNKNIYKLQDLLDILDSIFAKKEQENYKAFKIALAYMRSIIFDEVTFYEADKIFSNIFKLKSYGYLEKKDFISKDDLKPFQDFLVHYLIQKAIEYDLPVQIHTGIFENLWNDVLNSNPAFLINLFMKYRNCNFDIFHAGYPYSDQLIAISKQFPNVYFDLCWIVDISPALYKRVLNLLLEIIPSNKIFGFGGDYMFIEGLYGSQKIVRRAIADLLYEKIDQKYFKFDEAIEFAKKILYLNPKALYKW